MLYFLSNLEEYFGPFRLFKSHSFLIFCGLYIAFFLSFIGFTKFAHLFPTDRGKDFSLDKNIAKGKPTGTGFIFITVFFIVSLLFVPPDFQRMSLIILTFLTMLTGYFDDKSTNPWSEYKKAILDLVLSITAAVIISGLKEVHMWLPFINGSIEIPLYIFLPLATILIWTTINTTNCSDGLDGLSGTLVLLSLLFLGLILYVIVGHAKIAGYLLLPFYPEAAKWSIIVFIMIGSLLAYLWNNAYPSSILMGDAGSRALGFFIGITVLKAGNPFLLLIVASVLLINGGTGLVKVAFLRFLNIKIFHNTRFPLHDHMKEYRNWSNTQVLMKFVIVQLLITIGILGIMLKIR